MTHTQTERGHLIGIIGTGPAGLYATKKLTEAGAHVVLFNRDIKSGGLAEYGIFPTKHKMKEGLRKQFRRILAHPQVDYYGNCSVGEKGELTLADLHKLGFAAVICAAGAQGTKSLGLPGEDAVGVVHAKDLVYHYNHLPPFSQRQFPIGRRVAIIGMGNVMIDIAHYLLRLRQDVEDVLVVARRGPAERKYDEIPLETVVFAIGDRVDDSIGLPYAHGEFLTSAQADTSKTDGAAYQVYDPVHHKVLEHTYVVGWSRKASDGLVGKAKQDAEIGVETVLKALATIPAPDPAAVVERRQRIRRLVEERCVYPITKDEIALLEEAERQIAVQAQSEEYKFDSNEAMLEAINCQKARMT